MLNIVMEDLLEGHPISEKKMKEVLGHTPLQVCQLCCRPADVLMHWMPDPCTCRGSHYSSCRAWDQRLQVACGATLGMLVGLFYPTPLSAFQL